MSLTGVPLLATAALVTVAAGVAAGLLWSRPRRARTAVRAAALLLVQALVVLTVGLAVNRSQYFYPSWRALLGDTGVAATAAARPPGRLDAAVPADRTLVWPAGRPGLTSAPTVTVPAGYAARPQATYPGVLSLVDGAHRAAATAVARSVADAVTVVAVPAAAADARALAALPAALGADLRVGGHGWAVVATRRTAALAARVVDAAPQRFGALVVVGGDPAAVPAAPRTATVAVSLVTAEPPGRGRPGAAAPWPRAYARAAAQLAAPLAAPLRLPPSAPVPGGAGR